MIGKVHTIAALPDDPVTRLGIEIRRVLQPLLPASGKRIALVDFPNYANVGDSAIWLGEQLFLQQTGFDSTLYTCDIETYSRDRLAQAVGDGTILLQGGGNLGDLWPIRQLFREQIIRDFPSNRIIQLPQSICFLDKANRRRAEQVFARHPDLTLLVRDRPSLKIATESLGARASLCPDMAFALGRLERACDATIPCIWLYRDDKEGNGETSRQPCNGVWLYEWNRDEQSELLKADTLLRYRYTTETDHEQRQRIRNRLSGIYPRLAQERVVRGCKVLARGHSVITERLHGHILCLLMGIPHYIPDTRYGKTRNFVETWGYDSPLVHWCNTPDDALQQATGHPADSP